MLRILTWVALAIAVVSLLTGYVAFASFVTKQLSWSLVVLSSAYLFAVLAEDTFTTVLTASPAQH